MTSSNKLFLCALVALFWLWPSTSQAGDLRLALGANGAGTEWRGDAAAYGSLKLGYRFIDLLGIYVQGHEGYGVVDDRMLTLLSLGAQIWGRIGPTRPYARLGFLHQHEESRSVVQDDYAAAVFGIGDAIRHRAGGEVAVGLDFPMFERNDLQLFGSVEGFARLFPDDLGPWLYAGGGLSVGLNYHIEGAP